MVLLGVPPACPYTATLCVASAWVVRVEHDAALTGPAHYPQPPSWAGGRPHDRGGRLKWSLLAFAILSLLSVGGASTARAQEANHSNRIPLPGYSLQIADDDSRFTREDMLAALEGQSLAIRRIVYCECKYDPNVI